jgi:hypothetical protein
MRFRKETIEWKDDSTNLSRKKPVVESRLRTGYTRATHTEKNCNRHTYYSVLCTRAQVLIVFLIVPIYIRQSVLTTMTNFFFYKKTNLPKYWCDM